MLFLSNSQSLTNWFLRNKWKRQGDDYLFTLPHQVQRVSKIIYIMKEILIGEKLGLGIRNFAKERF